MSGKFGWREVREVEGIKVGDLCRSKGTVYAEISAVEPQRWQVFVV